MNQALLQRPRPSLRDILERARNFVVRRSADQDGPQPAIGRYAHKSWLRRHRWLCFLSLTMFAVAYGFVFAVFGRFLMVQLTAPLFALLGVLLWVLPDADHAPDRALTGSLTAFLFALLCWPDYIAFAVPGLPWVTAIRLFGAPMMLIMVYCVATSSHFRARMVDILGAAPEIWKLFVAFTMIAFCRSRCPRTSRHR